MSDLAIIIIALAIVVPVHFLPTFVAVERKHHNAVAIAVLNLLLGWGCRARLGAHQPRPQRPDDPA